MEVICKEGKKRLIEVCGVSLSGLGKMSGAPLPLDNRTRLRADGADPTILAREVHVLAVIS